MPDPKTSFNLIIIETELERFKFLVRSLLRTRIAKVRGRVFHPLWSLSSTLFRRFLSTFVSIPTHINPQIDRFALHYLNNASARARLSPSEAEYAATHQAMLAAHYQASFLGQFPLSLQRLDDTAGGIAMVEQPDADKAVFVRALVDSGIPVQVPGTDIEFILARGSVYVVRWSAVRDRVEGGEMELI